MSCYRSDAACGWQSVDAMVEAYWCVVVMVTSVVCGGR